MTVSVRGKSPVIAEDVFVAPTANLIGDVQLGEQSSVWFQCTLRGDVAPIKIGARSNVQDNTVIHGTFDMSQTIIDEDVTVGHSCVLHGCHIQSRSLIGMGSLILDNAIIPEDCLVGAGSLVLQGFRCEPGSLILGRPAKAVRPLNKEELESLKASAKNYLGYCQWYTQEKGVGQ